MTAEEIDNEDGEGAVLATDQNNYAVEDAWAEDDMPCRCSDCDWRGPYNELLAVEGTSLTPGDASCLIWTAFVRKPIACFGDMSMDPCVLNATIDGPFYLRNAVKSGPRESIRT